MCMSTIVSRGYNLMFVCVPRDVGYLFHTLLATSQEIQAAGSC